ncbi:GFA family protein [Roseovarius aquimarinus]|uniref:GFA family protein n=1 Tax=Roseovarius aquimarinus TaxID=1229156 RepID=A0ABW7I9M4_9RHOB
MLRGACLCGGVSYTAGPPTGTAIACHCDECRRQSGHHFAAVPVSKRSLRLERQDTLRWYRASQIGKRGFCGTCGATLFWRGDEGAHVHLLMGALKAPTGLRLGAHVWVREKGDYYDIGADLPTYREGEEC